MALPGAGRLGGITIGAVLGGLICLGLVLLAIAATVVLSLISVYTPPSGKIAAGDEFQFDTVALKFLYVNSTHNFTGASIADSPRLSTACTDEFENTGNQDVAGCVLSNSYGYGPYNDSTTSRRRRRALGLSGLYSFGKARIFFKRTCGKIGDKQKYIDNAALSKCVKKRLEICNGLFKYTATGLTEWTSLPTPFTITIVDSVAANYVPLTVSKLFVVGSNTADKIASSVDSNTNFQNNRGCRYIGPIALSQIAAIIASQSVETTTLPPTTQNIG